MWQKVTSLSLSFSNSFTLCFFSQNEFFFLAHYIHFDPLHPGCSVVGWADVDPSSLRHAGHCVCCLMQSEQKMLWQVWTTGSMDGCKNGPIICLSTWLVSIFWYLQIIWTINSHPIDQYCTYIPSIHPRKLSGIPSDQLWAKAKASLVVLNYRDTLYHHQWWFHNGVYMMYTNE